MRDFHRISVDLISRQLEGDDGGGNIRNVHGSRSRTARAPAGGKSELLPGVIRVALVEPPRFRLRIRDEGAVTDSGRECASEVIRIIGTVRVKPGIRSK